MAGDHTRCTPEGREIGANLVRLTEPVILSVQKEGEEDDRCPTCAFRLGTVPNGCPQTMLDAVKAVIEGVPFMCHHKKGNVCHGWYAARIAMGGRSGSAPYPFSHED